jgi:ubiquinone biosynthesis protein
MTRVSLPASEHLKRNKDIARLLFKYGRADIVSRAAFEDVLPGDFHADPHPGNVFLTDDGRIALLDLGMVSRLSPGRRDDLLKLLLAVSEGNGDRAAALALQIGEPGPDVDEAGLRHDTLSPDVDVNRALGEEAASLMQQRMQQGMSASNIFTAALETKEFLEQLPRRVNKVLDAVADNDLKLNIEVLDEGAVIDGLQKVANRITLGLLLAALIVGAAMLMRVETSFRLFGYPGLAMLFFLAAAGGGVWLGYSILTGDKPARRKR